MTSKGASDLVKRLWDLSSLGRVLSVRNRSHVLMLGLCAAAFAAVTVLELRSGRSVNQAAPLAINYALMLFLAWAVAREIDPDFTGSAFVATLAAALILLGGSAAAGALVGLLLALRIITRSTGKAPTTLDLLVLPLVSAAIAFSPRGWIGGVALAGALLWDGLLARPAPIRNYAPAAAAAGTAVAAGVVRETLDIGFVPPGPLEWAVVGGSVLAFVLMGRYVPNSPQDRGGMPIEAGRLEAGRRLALAAGIASFGLFGAAAVPLLSGVWSSFVGVAICGRATRGNPSRGDAANIS